MIPRPSPGSMSGMDGATAAIIVQIESLGFTVTVRRYDVQMSATSPAELHLVHVASDPAGDGRDEEYHCPCDLARAVGNDLEDG